MRFNLNCFRKSTENRNPEYLENDGKAIGTSYRSRSMINEIQLDGYGDEIRDKLTQLFVEYKNIDQLNVTNDYDSHVMGKKMSITKILKPLKLCFLIGLWIAFSVIFLLTDEKKMHSTSHCINRFKSVPQVSPNRIGSRIGIILEGDFTLNRSENEEKFLLVQLQSVLSNKSFSSLSEIWKIQIELNEKPQIVVHKHVFVLNWDSNLSQIQVVFENPFDKEFPNQIIYDEHPVDTQKGIIYGVILLVGMYVLIIWNIVHRTFATLLGSTVAIAFLALLDNRPAMSEIMSWIDIETLLLLFGMMTLVAILSDTGFFDYMAVYAFRISKGDIWLMIICLATFTATLSALLNNATTLLLMGPVIIRLCQVMELNPIPMMTIMICFSNIGGALTPVGDPPNIIIVSNSDVIKYGIDFPTFVLHMSFGVLVVCLQTYLQFRYVKFRRIEDLRSESETPETKRIKNEIDLWEKVKSSFQSSDDDEKSAVLRSATNVQLDRLKKQLQCAGSNSLETFQMILDDLERKHLIRDKVLLSQSIFCLFFVLSLFFLHFVPQLQRFSLGWTSLIGAFLLLILIDTKDIDAIIGKVEWSTLLFFSGLFIVIEALTKLGLIESIGQQTNDVILSTPPEYRLAVAIIIIVWVSAIASAFFDNIPITTMMIKIVIKLAKNHQLGLPLQPLIWALSFGACLGGNGTLIGATANVICAGVAEKRGYKFTFMQYFKIGFPIMIANVTTATMYLLIVHVFFEWH